MKSPKKIVQSKAPEEYSPGNVFTGEIVHVIPGTTSDVVTIRIEPNVQLTVIIDRIPCIGHAKLPAAPEIGRKITIGVPPPRSIEIFAWGGVGH